jgi:hypothetical protein
MRWVTRERPKIDREAPGLLAIARGLRANIPDGRHGWYPAAVQQEMRA